MTKFSNTVCICDYIKYSGFTPDSQNADINTSNGYHGSTK